MHDGKRMKVEMPAKVRLFIVGLSIFGLAVFALAYTEYANSELYLNWLFPGALLCAILSGILVLDASLRDYVKNREKYLREFTKTKKAVIYLVLIAVIYLVWTNFNNL
jgi:hypothetical protein